MRASEIREWGYHFYGDEFYIILQETDEDIIKNIAEHIRLELAKKQILHESSKVMSI